MRSLARALPIVALLALPGAARADRPVALGKIPASPSRDGTRFCEGSIATRVPSWK